MFLVFAQTTGEAAAYIREHDLDGARACSDLMVALSGVWIHEGDELYILPSSAPAMVAIIEQQVAQLARPPRIHRPLL